MKSAMRMQYVNFRRMWAAACMALLFLSSLAQGMGRVDPADPPAVRVGDVDVVRLDRLARFYGWPRVRSEDTQWTLPHGKGEWVLAADSRRASLNGVTLWLHEPVARRGRHVTVLEADVRTVLDPLLRPARHLRNAGHKTVAIDPGHGGRDPGGRGANGTEEKDIVLRISLKTAQRLRDAGYTVILTRDQDRALTLEERITRAQEAGADLFVSVHLNTSANTAARGTETFVLTAAGQRSTSDHGSGPFPVGVRANDFDGPSQVLGYCIQRRLLETTGNEDRGVRRARFHVLREAVSPAVLVECGFLTHLEEEKNLRDAAYQRKLAHGLAQGIMDYLALVVRAKLDDAL